MKEGFCALWGSSDTYCLLSQRVQMEVRYSTKQLSSMQLNQAKLNDSDSEEIQCDIKFFIVEP